MTEKLCVRCSAFPAEYEATVYLKPEDAGMQVYSCSSCIDLVVKDFLPPKSDVNSQAVSMLLYKYVKED